MKMLFTSLGRSVLGKTVPSVLEPPVPIRTSRLGEMRCEMCSPCVVLSRPKKTGDGKISKGSIKIFLMTYLKKENRRLHEEPNSLQCS